MKQIFMTIFTFMSLIVHAHHNFPKEFEVEFIKKGINIHHPSNLTWWESSSHLSSASDYNGAWRQVIYGDPARWASMSQSQVYEQAFSILKNHYPANLWQTACPNPCRFIGRGF